jgi:RND family efflux transporter MFP subunit
VNVFRIAHQPSFGRSHEFLGRVEAARKSRLAFDLSGEVIAVKFEEGDEVGKGEIIAMLDASRLEARERELAAARESASASHALAVLSLKRIEELRGTNAVPQQQLDDARAEEERQAAALRGVDAQLASLAVEVRKSPLRTPYAGRVNTRFVDEGEVVQPGNPIVELLEVGRLEARIGISPEVARGLVPGNPYELEEAQSIGPISATLRNILPARDDATRTVDAIFELPPANGESVLFPGDLVTFAWTKNVERTGAWIPRSALTESVRGLWACYQVTPLAELTDDGRAIHRLERRDVEVLEERADEVFISGMRPEGAQILADGVQRVAPGQQVLVDAEGGR